VLLLTLLGVINFSCQEAKNIREANGLWYAQPAAKWMEALQWGNGRLGPWFFGDPQNERIQAS